ncbi:sugar phosphate isomerase/epimerase family protein [Streptomyces sp. NPDC056387]|uniref:sugar phosphate isomerase/epimerase family protein n=1 Tax=Streptomyces sp. NPDC056387 TaxID=3345803 RepID=UPI0035DE789B
MTATAPPAAGVAVAAPSWRIGTDRVGAARAALAAGADLLHLDFGGAHRGPLLSEPAELRAAEAVGKDIRVDVLAVNHINDIGLADDRGTARPTALAVLERALDCALRLDVRVLHVPGFRRSLPATAGLRAGTADALRTLCERIAEAGPGPEPGPGPGQGTGPRPGAGITLAYESPLGARESLALARAVDHPALRLVLDTGNLKEAGHDPLAFARAVSAPGLLLPDLHVKEPAPAAGGAVPAPGTAFDDLPELLRHCVVRSVLVENDYRHAPGRLREDITLCRTAVGPSHDEDPR